MFSQPPPGPWTTTVNRNQILCVCVCVCMHVCVSVCAHACMCVCVYVCVCMCMCRIPSLKEAVRWAQNSFSTSAILTFFFGPGNPFVVRPHPIHFRTSFSTIFGLNSLGARSSLLVTTMQNVSKHHHMSFGGQNCSWLRTTGLRRWGSVGASPQVPAEPR